MIVRNRNCYIYIEIELKKRFYQVEPLITTNKIQYIIIQTPLLNCIPMFLMLFFKWFNGTQWKKKISSTNQGNSSMMLKVWHSPTDVGIFREYY